MANDRIWIRSEPCEFCGGGGQYHEIGCMGEELDELQGKKVLWHSIRRKKAKELGLIR